MVMVKGEKAQHLHEGKEARQGPWTPAGDEHASDTWQTTI